MKKNLTYLPLILPALYLLLLSFMLSSCSGTHTEVSRQQLEKAEKTPLSFQNGIPEKGKETRDSQWWSVFQDEQLDAFMSQLFEKNLDLESSYLKLKRFYAEYGIAGAGGLSIGTSADWSQSRSTSSITNENVVTDAYSFSMSASYELDLWGELEAREKAAFYSAKSASYDLQTLYISISAQAVDLYFLILERKEKVAIQKEIVSLHSKKRDLLQEQYKLGLLEPEAVFEIEKTLSNARAVLEGYKRDLVFSKNALTALTGDFLSGYKEISTEYPLQLPLHLPPAIPTDVIKNRPDVASSLMVLKSYDEMAAAAAADRYPSFSLTASGVYSATEAGDLFLPTSLVTKIAAGIGATLWDGGYRENTLKKRRIMVKEQLLTYRKAVLTAFREVEDALMKNSSSEKRYGYFLHTEKAAEYNWKMVEEKFKNGISQYESLLNAALSYQTAKMTRVSGTKEVINARVELARAIGGSWPEAYVTEKLKTEDSDLDLNEE